MKQLILVMSICFIAVNAFAQTSKNKKGFYLNPNFNHISYRDHYQHQNNVVRQKVLYEPNLTIGYLWGNRNRHNISLTSLDGEMKDYYKNIGAELRYSYDILTFRKNKFSFYTSPYLRGNMYYVNSTYKTQSGNHGYIAHAASIALGVAPVFEYKLGKRIDFVASLPFELCKQTYSKFENITDNKPKVYIDYQTKFVNQAEARIGIRLNLIRK